MKNILLGTSISLITLCGLFAHNVIAQDYPTFYSTDPASSESVPEVNFPATPAPCSNEDQDCIDTYMDSYADHLKGNMNAQRPPSPVYTWKDNECILGSGEEAKAKCDTAGDEWQDWNERAVTASLDFVQGADQSYPLECTDVYDWWGMTYVYKCQDVQ